MFQLFRIFSEKLAVRPHAFILLSFFAVQFAGAQMTALPVWNRRLITVELTIPGTRNWTVPYGITNLASVECWGAGGSSAYDFDNGTASYGAAGGGAYARRTNITVAPGNTHSYTVGAGGAPVTVLAVGNDGGSTSISSFSVSADGGKKSVFDTTGWTGGSGGLVANSLGELIYPGGAGGNANQENNSGAGGGGAGSPAGNGSTGFFNGDGQGGNSPGAGAGGMGGGVTNPGGTGGNHKDGGGGGGGGGSDDPGAAGGYPGGGAGSPGGDATSPSGKGGDGKIRIKYWGQ